MAVQYEIDASGWSRGEVIEYMIMLERKMHHQTHAAYEEQLPIYDNPFTINYATEWANFMNSGKMLSGGTIADAIKWALGAQLVIPSVEIVPGPMGVGGGLIYAALCAVKDERGFTHDDLLRGLFIAAANTTFPRTANDFTSGVRTRVCQRTYCGAMASAAVTEMAGGTPEQVENAASLSLQSAIGIPCDPVPGGFGQPCSSRAMAAWQSSLQIWHFLAVMRFCPCMKPLMLLIQLEGGLRQTFFVLREVETARPRQVGNRERSS